MNPNCDYRNGYGNGCGDGVGRHMILRVVNGQGSTMITHNTCKASKVSDEKLLRLVKRYLAFMPIEIGIDNAHK